MAAFNAKPPPDLGEAEFRDPVWWLAHASKLPADRRLAGPVEPRAAARQSTRIIGVGYTQTIRHSANMRGDTQL
jgi:hypothetical protein